MAEKVVARRIRAPEKLLRSTSYSARIASLQAATLKKGALAAPPRRFFYMPSLLACTCPRRARGARARCGGLHIAREAACGAWRVARSFGLQMFSVRGVMCACAVLPQRLDIVLFAHKSSATLEVAPHAFHDLP